MDVTTEMGSSTPVVVDLSQWDQNWSEILEFMAKIGAEFKSNKVKLERSSKGMKRSICNFHIQ